MLRTSSRRGMIGLVALVGTLAGAGVALTPSISRADPPLGNYKCNRDMDGCLTGNYICEVSCWGGSCDCTNT